jgi:hypothetical protein
MARIVAIIEIMLRSSVFWGVVALVLGAVAISGKFSMRGADTVLIIAWLVALVGVFRGHPVSEYDLVLRFLVTALCASVLGLGFYKLSTWFHLKSEEPTIGLVATTNQDRPYLQAALIIDAVKGNKIESHLQIENIGKMSVTAVHHVLHSPKFASVGEDPHQFLTIPPGGKAALDVSPLPLLPEEYNPMSVSVFYDAIIGGNTKSFTTAYRFVVEQKDLVSQRIINPHDWKEEEGRPDEAELQKHSYFQALEMPQGSIVGTLYEVGPDGKPNQVEIQHAGKLFTFDPITRKIMFQVTTVTGRVATAEQPMPVTPNGTGAHVVAIIWDSAKGARLGVDQVVKDDMQP